MTKGERPRRGSMAYWPRKRARSIVARVRRWKHLDEVKLLGFAGYKVGTLHVIMLGDNPNSPFYKQEIAKVATVIETPPLKVVGIRVYESTPYGKKTLTEVWAKDLPEDLKRVFTVPKKRPSDDEFKKELEKLRSMVDRISEVRAIVAMQPRLAGIHKKKPEVFEIPIGGPVKDALEYAISKLGGEIRVDEVFSEGDFIDVSAVTKGKGFCGVIKRFGVKELPRWHKHRKGSRRIGSVGPTGPAIMFYTPFPGQHGFHQRTEYNKRILKIGDLTPEPRDLGDGKKETREQVEERIEKDNVNPAGGWPHYGLVRSMYVLVEGTVPGPPKRLVKFRFALRPRLEVREKPQIVYISTRPVEEVMAR